MRALCCHSFAIATCLFVGISSMVVPPDSNGIFNIPNTITEKEELLEKQAQFMLANMNQSIDPCENFYEYACGNWKNDILVPIQSRNEFNIHAMQFKIGELIVGFLKNTTGMDEKTAETKAKKLFRSCMSMSEDLNQGYQVMLESIKSPVSKEGEPLDWIDLNFYSEYGVHPFLPITVKHDCANLDFVITIDEPSEYLTESTFNAKEFLNDLKFTNKEEVEKELAELKIFEKKLIASVTPSNSSESQTLDEFLSTHNSTDGLDWNKFFQLAINSTIKDSWEINNRVSNFSNLDSFLKKSDTNLMFRYVKWRNILNFYQTWTLKTPSENVESKCLQITMLYMHKSFEPWYIETVFDKERRKDALLIAQRLKDTFYSFLEHNAWLDNETKSEAKSKLRAMDVVVGYTDDMKHRHTMDSDYKDVAINNNYWKNLMNLEKLRAKTGVRCIGRPIKKPYQSTLHEVNANYDDRKNSVFIAIGISQLPLYHIQMPHSLKFGGIGYMVGHEMGHGFDSTCYKNDYDGKTRNWWSPDSLRNFKERYQCLESQYNKFILNGVQTNGNMTSGDNIADNVGARVAYHSYLQYLKEDGVSEDAEDKPLPGIDLNNKQLFFLKFAQNWCDNRSTEDRIWIMKTDPHALEEFRVVGTLMNMPEFSEEFQCALGTGMNPLKKCVIW